MSESITRSIFNNYDKEKSGTIPVNQFKYLIYDLGYYLSDADSEATSKKIDVNNDKKISYEEFSAWWNKEDRLKKLHGSANKLIAWATYFRAFDKDHSGVLVGDEIKQLHDNLVKKDVTDKSLDTFISEVDTNKNGQISFNEYVDWLLVNGKQVIE